MDLDNISFKSIPLNPKNDSEDDISSKTINNNQFDFNINIKNTEPSIKTNPNTPASSKKELSATEKALGDAYALRYNFLKLLPLSLIIGLILGLLSFLFLEIVDRTTSIWFGSNPETSLYDNFPDNLNSVNFYNGKLYWLAITTGGGLLLGILKVLLKYREGEVATFFQEITSMHTDIKDGLSVALCGLISLLSGASLGPEAPMGALGGATATIIGHYTEQSHENLQILTICGMAAGMVNLFGAPILSAILVLELAVVSRKRLMEVLVLIVASCGVSFTIFQGMATNSVFYTKPNYGPTYSAQYTMGFSLWYLLEAIPLGIIAALFGVFILIIRGICEAIVSKIQGRLGFTRQSTLSLLFFPIIGGILIGSFAILMPLTIGDGHDGLVLMCSDGYSAHWNSMLDMYGNSTIGKIEAAKQVNYLQHTYALEHGWPVPTESERLYSKNFVVSLIFLKMVTYGISHACGFVGGIIFPFFFIGGCLGNLISQITGINQTFACIAMMVSVPTAFAPVPFLFLVLQILTFGVSSLQTAPILLSMCVAHLTLTGLGVLKKLRKLPLPDWESELPSIQNENQD